MKQSLKYVKDKVIVIIKMLVIKITINQRPDKDLIDRCDYLVPISNEKNTYENSKYIFSDYTLLNTKLQLLLHKYYNILF